MTSEHAMRQKTSGAGRGIGRLLRSMVSGVFTASQRNRGRRLLREEEGAEMVEFAISAVVLFTFVFGIIEFCIVLFMFNTAAEAARATSRWASVRGTDCNNPGITDGTCPGGAGATGATVQTAAQTFLKNIPGAGGMTVTLQWCTAAGACGTTNLGAGAATSPNTVQAKVSYTFAYVPFVTRNPLTVSSTSQSVIW